MNRIMSALLIIVAILYVSCLEDAPVRNNPHDSSGDNFQGWDEIILSKPSKGMTYNLTWTDTGAGSYIIEEAKKTDFTDATSYQVNGITLSFSHNDEGATYFYRVRTNTGIKDIDWSNIVSAKIPSPWYEVGIDYEDIPGGSFLMGDIQNYNQYSAEKPVHTVAISSFEMGVYEVTQEQYQSVMGSNPSYFSGTNLPVERVSWYEAVKYCNALSVTVGLTPCYNESSWSCDFSADGFRLPTEAEWEYACRAETETKYYTGNADSDLATAGWYWDNSSTQTRPVGQKTPNAFGLYDMHGNVWEWCNDWYGESYYSSSPSSDPTGPTSGSARVGRGGSWGSGAIACRSSNRYGSAQTYTGIIIGFRVVRRSAD